MIGIEGAKPEKHVQLTALRQTGVQLGRTLTGQEERDYLSRLALLRDHDRASTLIEITTRNFAAFKAAVSDITHRIAKAQNRAELQREAEIEINRHFLNYLSAMRQFLDHTETRFKRRGTEGAAHYEVFRVRTAHSFDTFFAYRFLYKLRNYGQHCGAPVGSIDLESKAIGSTGLVEHTAHLRFDPTVLLTEGRDSWGKRVRQDLETQKGKFNTVPLADEHMRELLDIWDTVRAAEKPELLYAAAAIVELLSEAPSPRRVATVSRVWHRKKSSSIEFLHPPPRTMRWLGYSDFPDAL